MQTLIELEKSVCLAALLVPNMLTLRKMGKTKGILLRPIKRNVNTFAGGGGKSSPGNRLKAGLVIHCLSEKQSFRC